MTNTQTEYGDAQLDNPIDTLEAIFKVQEWPFNRFNEDEFAFVLEGVWSSYDLFFAWDRDEQVLDYSCSFNLDLAPDWDRGVVELLYRINTETTIGHFSVCNRLEKSVPVFQHAIPKYDAHIFSAEQLGGLINLAFRECELFYPVFLSFLHKGRTPEEAMKNTLLDCQGEA